MIIAAVVLLVAITASAGTGRRRIGRRTRHARGGGGLVVLVLGAIIGATVAGEQLVRALVIVAGAVLHWLGGMLP